MGVARSSYCAAPAAAEADAALVEEMRTITDAWECCGYRRVGAELRHRGRVVNGRKVRRLMKLHDLNPRRRRRFAKTTDSDHDGPIHPLIAKGFETHVPDRLRVGGITFVAIASGFVCVAIVLDAWSRRVVGYAIGRRVDARLAVAAFARAIALRRPLPGCVKRHIMTDTYGRLLTVEVHAADVQDRDSAKGVLRLSRRAFAFVETVFADGGYAGRLVDWAQTKTHVALEIVKRPRGALGFVVIRRRWVVEGTFAWIMKCRRLVRDYEQLTAVAEALITVAAIATLVRRLA